MSGEIQKQFLLTSKIGNGNFSTVYLAKHIQTQQIVAVKTMKNHIPIAIKEAQLLKKMNHPNVIKLYKFQKPKNKQQALIVLEYVPQNILELYQSQQYGLKQDQVKCILFQSCLGLYHIHKKGIIHRDIKPENIMINRNKAEVKLIDFGLAIEQDKCITDYVATRWYRAPENLLGTKQYTVAIDIFSLGCVIVQLYLGNPLFPGTNNIDQISKILTVIGQPSYQSWKKGYEMFVKLGLNFQIKQERKKITLKSLLSSCSEGLTKIIQKMLILNPSKRISAEQILKDSYFKDIQKIIPPHVYDQYLIDMKTNVRTSFIKEPPKAQKKNQSKQRVRFLSEEKSFGAFSSFKSSNGFNNKLQSELIKKEKKLTENLSPTKKILVQASKRQEFSNNEGIQIVSSKKSTRSSFISNQIINNTNSTKNIDAGQTSSIKSSLEKYQKNIMKLSNSLKKIEMIKSSQYLTNVQNPPAKIVPTQQILHFDREITTDAQLSSQRSAQMLSFRGFNQPKQKISIRQSGSILYKKASSQQQKSDKFPVKNKKVMEYLQKFQNIANHSNFQRQNLQNSRSEPVINKNIIITRKTPGLVQINQKQASIHQTPQKHQNEINSSQSLYRLSSKQKDHMVQYQTISTTNLSQSFNNFPEQIQIVNNDNLKSRESMYSSLNSPSMVRNHPNQKPAQIQLNIRPLKQGPLVKFTSMNRQMHESQNPAQNSFRSSKVRIQDETNHLSSPVKNSHSHVFFAENINSSQKFEPNPLVSSTSFSSTPSIGQSINRPIQNKIKLIAVRDNIPNNRQGQVELNSSIPNLNLLKSTSIGPMAQNLQQKNIPHYTAICSPRKVSYYRVQESSNMYQPQIQENRIYLNQEEQSKKTKFFKSMEHRQFFTKKGPPNRYSFNTNDEGPNITFPSSNLPNNLISNGLNNINSPQSFQVQPQSNSSLVHHQTTLSQLRQSITGLTQTLNQGVFLSQRSQKVNNKNININLNLNIYEKRSPRKK